METQVNLSNLGEIEVSYKYHNELANRPVIQSHIDAFSIVKELYQKERMGLQEQFVVIFLNRANAVIGSCNLFNGGISACAVDIKIILATGLKLLASSVIVSHNHPSGNLKPSEHDIALTKKIKSALEAIEMTLLDHIIISPDYKYCAFTEKGLL
jgi:DNA repair protein RadC